MSDPSTHRPPGSAPSGKGLYSVAQIHHILLVEFTRAQRYRYALTCMVVEVDRLEALRDVHGYEAKEEVVDAVVTLLRENLRSSDHLGRTADDRLLVLAPHTDEEGARVLASRIVEDARSLSHDDGAEPFRVTLSVGATTLDGEGPLFHDALLGSAELAVAQALETGGDRFVARPCGAG